jgi:Beta-propeller repeat
VQVAGMAMDTMSNLYVLANRFVSPVWIVACKYSSSGNELWTGSDFFNITPATGLALDSTGRTFITGEASPTAPSYPNMSYGTVAFDTNGSSQWTNYYPEIPTTISEGKSIAVDVTHGVYVTGHSPGTNGTNDIVTIKYDPNGNQIWLQRYSSPSGGDAVGNAIAVDNNGNVYVTGYDTTAQGGTEIVTIKYSPVTLQRHSDGTVILQAQGAPGESFDIEASTNLLDWLDLGTVQADTNGRVQFDDTNAPTFPARFYYTTPQ